MEGTVQFGVDKNVPNNNEFYKYTPLTVMNVKPNQYKIYKLYKLLF